MIWIGKKERQLLNNWVTNKRIERGGSIGKIMILSVSESNGELFDKILEFIKHSGASDVTEINIGNQDVIRIGKLVIDSLQHTIYKEGKEIYITNTEFRILYFLALHRGMTMSKEQIYEYVWSGEYILDDSNITSHIRRLRVKIEDEPAKPKYIQTVRGIGYRMLREDNVE